MGASNLKRLPWVLSLVFAVICGLLPGSPLFAQDAPAAAAERGVMGFSADLVPFELQQDFRQMVHFYRIARPEVAADFAQRVLQANPDPVVLLRLVEHPDIGYSLLVQMSVAENEQLSEAAGRLRQISDQAIQIKRREGDRILNALRRLTGGDRAYQLALSELRYSGEYVVPYALALLETAGADQAAAIRRALLAIDRPVVWPLVVALETPQAELKVEVIDLLGGLGYQVALPGLKVELENQENSVAVREAAERAIRRINAAALERSARSLYVELAEGLYYGRVATPLDENRPTTDVWGWVPEKGLDFRPVPNSAVNEVMASREAEHGLMIAPDAPELVSLWLTIQAKINAELRIAGVEPPVNPWAPADMPTTAFYLRAAGQQYSLDVLARSLRDNDVDVALQVLSALQQVANQRYLNIAAAEEGSPLISALSYPDRLVRFSAAFAIVAIQPREEFFGADRVVPVLAEAVQMESGPSVLIIEEDAENRNRLKAAFRQADWNVVDASTGDTGISAAHLMGRLDAVILSPGVTNVGYADVIRNLRRSFATALVPVIVLEKEAEAVPFSQLSETFKYLAQVPSSADLETIVSRINVLLAEAGTTALESEMSQRVSLRAARDLTFIATARTVLNARPARGALLAAAAGRNADLAITVIGALVQMPDDEIQQQLAAVGLDADKPQNVRIAALQGVADTARHIGNQLTAETVSALQQRVATEADAPVRDAIGTVLGALDLEAELASQLIRNHAILQNR